MALRCGGVIYNQRPSRLAADRSHFASNRELDCQAGARLAAATAPAPTPSYLGCVCVCPRSASSSPREAARMMHHA